MLGLHISSLEKENNSMKLNEIYRERVLEILSEAEIEKRPLCIKEIQDRTRIKYWSTCKNVIFELVALGKVRAVKSGRAWFFLPNKDIQISQTEILQSFFEEPITIATERLGNALRFVFKQQNRTKKTKPLTGDAIDRFLDNIENFCTVVEKTLVNEGFSPQPHFKQMLKQKLKIRS